jgi:signal transduction histidine kinase
MRELITRSRILDLLLAAAIGLPGLIAMGWSSAGRGSGIPAAVFLVALMGSVLTGRRWPVAGAAVASLACIVAAQTGSFNPNGSSVSGDLITVGALLWVVVLAGELGVGAPLWWGLLGLACVVVATQWNDLNSNLNPFPTVLAIGFWLVGRTIRARRNLIATLHLRALELAAERQNYAVEAVRYERAWIARELHDVIAHCMSIVVVQASAGQRLESRDPTVIEQVLDDIGELARQAESDLTGLTGLLSRKPASNELLSRAVIDLLVARAISAGNDAAVTVEGELDMISPLTATTLGRVLQEGITNAIKYAPGASLRVVIRAG